MRIEDLTAKDWDDTANAIQDFEPNTILFH